MRRKIILYYNDRVFSPSESFLFKDFGQVPFVLSELNDTDLEYWIAAENPNPAFNSFRGKRVRQFTKRFRWLPARLDLLKNDRLYKAFRRDAAPSHIVLFPFTPLTDLMIARRMQRRGTKIIVKLDTNRVYLDRLAADWAKHRAKPMRFLRQSFHYREILRLADAVLCETSECEELLRQDFLDLKLNEKLVKTFNGLSRTWLSGMGIDDNRAVDRRQSIVVSGRISSWEKHTGLILEAGPPPPGWMIEFIGEVDADLEKIIMEHRAADPDFDRHYRFHGAINDKRLYFETLMGARALLLNSRVREGFPNVFAEAHFCRLFIVTSDVSGAFDATGEGRWGLIYRPNDVTSLRDAISAVPERVADNAVPDTHRQQFIWEHSLDQPAVRRVFDSASPSSDAAA